MQKPYDFLIVGSGLYGSVCAFELHKKGYKCLVVEKRNHIGGNIYTENLGGINVHRYGAHIFHTSRKEIWDYIHQFAEFNDFINSPIAIYKGERYHLPFNMNTFKEIWPDLINAEDAKKRIDNEINGWRSDHPENLEQQAINLVGKTIYDKLIKGYTSKQWGRPCTELPPFIIKRIPVRFEYNNNYFSDPYQGIPIGGYTAIIQQMLSGVDVLLNCDYFKDQKRLNSLARSIIYTGPIDRFFNYKYGPLEYRTLRFELEQINKPNYQGNAVINYTDEETPYTRIIEHRFFEKKEGLPYTVITKEYPSSWEKGDEPYYPINDDKNLKKYSKYRLESKNRSNIHFGGRLGQYQYFDMDRIIYEALAFTKNIKER